MNLLINLKLFLLLLGQFFAMYGPQMDYELGPVEETSRVESSVQVQEPVVSHQMQNGAPFLMNPLQLNLLQKNEQV